MSDHHIIYCTRKINRNRNGGQKYINFRSLKNYSAGAFVDALKDLDFPDYSDFTDIDDAYSDFISKISKVIDNLAPMKQSRIKNNSQEWFDGEIMEKIAIRDKLFKKFKNSKLHVDNDIFKEAKKEVVDLINRKKKEFFENKLNENIGKPKELWKTLSELGLSKKTSGISNICLKNEGENVFDPKLTANIFKDYFSNLAKKLVAILPKPPKKFGERYISSFYEKLNINSIFSFKAVDEETIVNILQNMKESKAPGIDNINGRFLKDGAKIIAKPIAQLCNLSLSSSSFPSCCKTAKLKPLFKKGSKTDPQNYRPISLLPIISKVIERVVHNQTNSFLTKNKVLYNFQSGFRNKHSTDSCLSYLNDKILKGFDSGLLTGMILIDLQKAFDTIDHEVLFKKLSYMRFSPKTISWFKSYLSNRTFKVNINKVFSDPGDLTCGVPQGSILGPLIFLLYVNDMPQSVECNLYLYADDSCLVFQHKNVKEIEKQLNKDFSNLCDWFLDNKLSIHFGEEKTKSILFANKIKVKKLDKLDIIYKDIKIKQHSNVKYLGCILDETLNGESMALHVLNKVNSKLKFLYRKNKFLSPALRRLLCNAIIQPHFDYACSAWFPNLNLALKKKLQTAQNRCVRFCLQLGNRDHVGNKEFEKMNWLNINDRFEQCVSTSVFKFFSNNSPLYISEIFCPAGKKGVSTRNSFQRLTQPLRKTSQGQKCLSYIGPSVWNKLPENIKKSSNLVTFKHEVKKYYLNELKKKEQK